jgi:hypothetical protein
MEVVLLHTLDERFSKIYIVIKGNHENNENKIVEPQSHIGNILMHLENVDIDSYNHDISSLQDLHHQGSKRTQGAT